jgi:hypothetical protein
MFWLETRNKLILMVHEFYVDFRGEGIIAMIKHHTRIEASESLSPFLLVYYHLLSSCDCAHITPLNQTPNRHQPKHLRMLCKYYNYHNHEIITFIND